MGEKLSLAPSCKRGIKAVLGVGYSLSRGGSEQGPQNNARGPRAGPLQLASARVSMFQSSSVRGARIPTNREHSTRMCYIGPTHALL
jgi:hypothetical protein